MNSIGTWKHRFDRRLEKTMHLLESIIAAFAMVVLVYVMCMQMWGVLSHPSHLLESEGLNHFLHELLTVVVGFEFVKLLMHVTPDNVLEVMIMAVARHFVVGSGSALDTLLNVIAVMLCIIGIIAVRAVQYHKRLALETGEDPKNNPIEYVLESIKTIYSIQHKNGAIRRVNVNIAATTVENYRKLKDAGIGTYILFQETYHKEHYEELHPSANGSL